MSRRRFKVPIVSLLTAATLAWGAGGAGAACPPGYTPPPQLVAGVDYCAPNYANSPILRKFVDSLPGLGPTGANTLGQYIPVAVADKASFPGSDYYEIALVDYTEQLHSDLGPTQLRGYVQVETPANAATSKHIPLPGGLFGYDNPSYLGPTIVATQGIPTRVKFYNLLPAGPAGDLFIPTDVTVMGAGMGPDGSNYTKNRATLHLHGGDNPWISDGTAHQWITPAGETGTLLKGVSQRDVPDMPAPPVGSATYYWPNGQSGRLMFFHDHAYGMTRLDVYAGEAAGYLLTDSTERKLNSFAPGGEIPLVIQDKTFVNDGTVPAGFPATGVATQATTTVDPLWATGPWGQTKGSLWLPHVYMPNQNPNDITGANPMGRWDYGAWFWPVFPSGTPPVTSIVPEAFMDTPLVNGTAYPYMNVNPTTYRFRILNAANDRYWNLQFYVADPTVVAADGRANTEVRMIPAVKGTGVAAGALDTTATTPVLWPAAWTANDTPGMIPNILDNRMGGVPDPSPSLQGPQFIHIGAEGGISPAANVMVNTPIGYEQNKRSVTVLNTMEHTLFLGPAERADVIVDFSQYAGKTLILYNDSPAPVPAGDPRYDYYTGNPDNRVQGGAPTTQVGYGPNTRTVMQIRVAAAPVTTTGPIGTLAVTAPGAGYTAPTVTITDPTGTGATASATVSTGSVSGITVTVDGFGYVSPVVTIGAPNLAGGVQATATATLWAFGGVASIVVTNPGSGYTAPPTVTIADVTPGVGVGAAATAAITSVGQISGLTLLTPGTGYTAPAVTITDATGTGATATASLAPTVLPPLNPAPLNTAVAAAFAATQAPPIVPLGQYARISDTSMVINGVLEQLLPKTIQELFDPLGRMNATLGVEVPFTTATVQTTIPYGFSDPVTELGIDGDTQLWKITHNGVDTHAIHFHLFNVQLVNRVGWDGAIKPPWPEEVGWKETVKMNPLEDIVVALKMKTPTVPFQLPINQRMLDPTQPAGSVAGFLGVDPHGNPVTVANKMVNYGDEYTWHCHLLGHEENDMMRPMAVARAPLPPTNLAFTVKGSSATLTWQDNSPDESGYTVQRKIGTGPWTTLATVTTLTYTDTGYKKGSIYQVVAVNTVGSLIAGYPSVTATSLPSNQAAAPLGTTLVTLSQALPVASPVVVNWTYSAADQTGFTVQRSTSNTFPTNGTTSFNVAGNVFTFNDTTVVVGLRRSTTYYYRVIPTNAQGSGAPSNVASLLVHP